MSEKEVQETTEPVESKTNWNDLFIDHPLRPYILKANQDLRGEQTPYTPIKEVWHNEYLSEDGTEFLLDYLKLVEIQVNRVDKLVDSAQEYCDRMIETFPDSQHITKKETAKVGEKRKKRSQPHVNIARENQQWVPNLAHPFFPMATPEALAMQAQFFNTPFLNPSMYSQYGGMNPLGGLPDAAPSEGFGVNVQSEKSKLDCINKDITKTTA